MTKKIYELHELEGKRKLTEQVRERIPFADWLEHPEKWDKKEFIRETSDYLHDVCGVSDAQNKHSVAMLADQMEIYIKASIRLQTEDLVVETNNGKTLAPNPVLTVRNKALELSIKIMTELGLTPKSRLKNTKSNDMSSIDELLLGPKSA